MLTYGIGTVFAALAYSVATQQTRMLKDNLAVPPQPFQPFQPMRLSTTSFMA